MNGDEQVEDTRTLQPGDRVRVVLEGTVDGATSGRHLAVRLDPDWSNIFRHNDDALRVYRLPKPLPPEPPVGAEVLDVCEDVWIRMDLWRCKTSDLTDGHAWEALLRNRGPVRLLGDPIEAPR